MYGFGLALAFYSICLCRFTSFTIPDPFKCAISRTQQPRVISQTRALDLNRVAGDGLSPGAHDAAHRFKDEICLGANSST